ncbi:MAG TPA: hypothetical protein VGW38_11790, partial [Chloroflexota bacterium]|nr:hypothetical protein [Chloroflexota bacterium]
MQDQGEHVLPESGHVQPATTRVGVRPAIPARWRLYVGALGLLLYALVFVRGLAWQWQTVLTGTADRPLISSAPPPAPRSSGGEVRAPAAAAAPRAKTPLPPTDE